MKKAIVALGIVIAALGTVVFGHLLRYHGFLKQDPWALWAFAGLLALTIGLVSWKRHIWLAWTSFGLTTMTGSGILIPILGRHWEEWSPIICWAGWFLYWASCVFAALVIHTALGHGPEIKGKKEGSRE